MNVLLIVILAGITIFASILLVLTLISYKTYKTSKLLLISGVFLVLLIRGILLTYGFFSDTFAEIVTNEYLWIVDLLILLFLYAGYSLKR